VRVLSKIGSGLTQEKGEIIAKLREMKSSLAEHFNVATIDLFGCYATGDIDEGSEIGLLVTYTEPLDPTELCQLVKLLQKKLNTEVNLVSKSYLSPSIKEKVLKGAIPI
jgi:predicted nucleotidyltransferase